MPRHFDRTADDYVLFSPGNLTDATAAVTVGLIWYTSAVNVAQGLIRAEDAANAIVWGVNPYLDGVMYFSQSGFATMGSYTADEWRLDLFGRPAGTSQTVRGHYFTYNAATWSHADGTGGVNNSTASPVDHIYLGRFSSGDDLAGEIAVAAVWERALSDGECESLPYSLDAWRASTPDALWVLNQGSVATMVPDQIGAANQSGISGTTVSSLEVPGFAYVSGSAFPSVFGGRGSRGLALRAQRSMYG